MINLLLFNNFYPMIATYVAMSSNEEKKRQIIVYGSVTRYGPRNQLPAQEVNIILIRTLTELT